MHGKLGKKVLLSTIAALVLVATGQARFNVWEPENGVMVRQGHHIFWMMSGVATDDAGNFVVTWSDAHTGAQNIYAQKYDANGSALWGDEPVVVSSGDFAQQNPSVFYAGDGEWVFGWQDHRDDEFKWGYYKYTIQRLDSNGAHCWDEDIIVTPTGSDYFYETVLPCANGDVIIVYRPMDNFELVATRITPEGVFAWGEQAATIDSAITYSASLTTDDHLVLAWQKQAARIFCQAFSPEGNALWNEGEPVLISNDNTYYHAHVSAVTDVNGGAYVMWERHIDNHYYGQHLDSDGNPQWGDNGAVLFADLPSSFEPSWLQAPDGDLFLAYRAYANSSTYTGCQRFILEEGDLVAQWGDNNYGIIYELESGGFDAPPHVLLNENDGILFSAFTADWSDETPYDVAIYNLDEDGNPVWEGSNPVILETAMPPCSNSQEPELVNGRPYIFWREMGPGAGSILFNSLDPASGNIQHDEATTVVSGLDNRTYANNIIRSGESIYISWMDWRYSEFGDRLFMQRLNPENGMAMWETQGINVSEPGDEDANISIYDNFTDICPDGNGGAYVFYSLMDPSTTLVDMLLRRVDESGNLVWGEDAIILGDAEYDVTFEYHGANPYLLDDGTVFTIFTKYDPVNWYAHIVAQRFNQNGELLLNEGEPVTLIAYDDADALIDDILLLENQTIAIVYSSRNDMTKYTYLALFDADGNPLWDEPVLISDERLAGSASLTWREDRIICTWTDDHGNADVILAKAFYADGTPVWEDEIECARGDILYDYTLVDKWDSEFWIVWKEYSSAEIYYQQYNYECTPQLFPLNGKLLELETPEDYSRNDLQGVSDGSGGLYLFWYEGDNSGPSDYGYTHLLADGELAMDEYIGYGVYLTDAIFMQTDLVTIPDGEGGVLAAWTDYRGSGGLQDGDDVYAMRICDYQFSGVSDKQTIQPVSWELHGAYPNPFNPSTTLSFTAPRTSEVTLAVYDVLGRKVATLMDGVVQAGRQQVIWQGHSDQGMPVASGTYFVRLEGDGVNLTRKMVLLK